MTSGIGKLAGAGAAGEQLLIWEVLGAIISAVLGPELTLLTREVNKVLPATPVTPEQLADMVVRHIVQESDGESYARESGIAPADFRRLVQSAGEGLAPGDLVEALRRGIIPESGTGADVVSFEQGVAESHLRDKWTGVLKALGTKEPSPIDALEALLEGQLSRDRAFELYVRFGGDPEHFQWLFDSRGSAPTPLELSAMANRKIIPWDGEGPDSVAYHQGFLEGPWRDKWEEPYRKLAQYLPPPRTVTAMVRDGSLTDAQAVAIWEQSGLSPELSKAYLASAHHERTATHRATISTELRAVARRAFADGHIPETRFRELLAQASVPADLIDREVQAAVLAQSYGRHTFSTAEIKRQRQSGLIDDTQARQRLIAAGWSEEDAQLQVSEWNAESQAGRTGLTESRILAYLKSNILTATEAYDLLLAQHINAKNAAFLVQHPEAVPATRTHGSTSADIIAAYKDGILNIEQATTKLIEAGDTSDAANLKLQVAHYTLNRGPKPKLQHKNLTEAQILDAFKHGLVADTWAIRELETQGHSHGDAVLLVTLEEVKSGGAVPPDWTVLH